MLKVALTGSIGMGKSTTARMFADRGVPVWDADAAVHRLYGPGGAGARAIAALVPETVGSDGVDRGRLRAAVMADEALLARIEAAVHPLVAADRAAFLAEAETAGASVALCDIPLLFETGAEPLFDRVVVVSAPHHVQRRRVLERPGMTEETLDRIHARQVPDAEKRARADFVIETHEGMAAAEERVTAILAELGKEAAGPKDTRGRT